MILSIAVGVFAVGTTFGMVEQMLPTMDAAHKSTLPSHVEMLLDRPVERETLMALARVPVPAVGRLALAGGTMEGPRSATKSKASPVFQQQQMVFIDEDRLVTVQFTALEKEFSRFEADLLKVFASFRSLGVKNQ